MLYYRRKILLALLEIFDGQLTAKSLQKYLFLFTRNQEKKAFDFVPYRYGCYSFQANQDLATMAKYGYLAVTEGPSGRNIQLIQKGTYLSMLDKIDRDALEQTKRHFGKLSQTELIRYTYQKYPYYAINSSIAAELLSAEELATVNQQKLAIAGKGLFSIGYEGISLETYINKLIVNDVKILCDVRRNAYSQKYGFSKGQLQKACEGVGIRYIHLPELGIESEQRQQLNSQNDYDLLFERYEVNTLKSSTEAIRRIQQLIKTDNRVALTCFEKNPAQCHRTRIINKLLEMPDADYPYKLL